MNWLKQILGQPPVMRGGDYVADSQVDPAVVPTQPIVPKQKRAAGIAAAPSSYVTGSSFIDLHSIENPSVRVITEGLINIDQNLNLLLNVLRKQLAFDKAQADVVSGGPYGRDFGSARGTGTAAATEDAAVTGGGGGVGAVVPIVRGRGAKAKPGRARGKGGRIKGGRLLRGAGRILGTAALLFALAETTSSIKDLKDAYEAGEISKAEMEDGTAKQIGGLGGLLAGASGGAYVGAAAGPWGAAIGGILGGLAGMGAGEWAMDQIPDSVKTADSVTVKENGKDVIYRRMRDGKYQKEIQDYKPIKSRGETVGYINGSKTITESKMTKEDLATAKKYLAPQSTVSTSLSDKSMAVETASRPTAPTVITMDNSSINQLESSPPGLSVSDVIDPSGPVIAELVYYF